MGSGGWRWWFRTRCGAIAGVEHTDDTTFVRLCNRRRWHRGICEP